MRGPHLPRLPTQREPFLGSLLRYLSSPSYFSSAYCHPVGTMQNPSQPDVNMTDPVDQIRPKVISSDRCPGPWCSKSSSSPRLLSDNLIGTTNDSARSRTSMDLMTPDETAAMLRISKTTLYRLVARRVLRFYRVSGMLRFDRNDVEEFITRGLTEPVEP